MWFCSQLFLKDCNIAYRCGFEIVWYTSRPDYILLMRLICRLNFKILKLWFTAYRWIATNCYLVFMSLVIFSWAKMNDWIYNTQRICPSVLHVWSPTWGFGSQEVASCKLKIKKQDPGTMSEEKYIMNYDSRICHKLSGNTLSPDNSCTLSYRYN